MLSRRPLGNRYNLLTATEEHEASIEKKLIMIQGQPQMEGRLQLNASGPKREEWGGGGYKPSANDSFINTENMMRKGSLA